VARGRFRDDLFYRLSVVPVFLPPLRERRNDIPLLVEHFLQRLAADTGRAPVRISPEALDVMLSYAWPGNVRELQNWLQFALVKCRGDVIRAEHLPPVAGGQVPASGRPRRRKLDAESVRQALLRTNGNRVEAARALGVSRATLYRFLSEYGASL
jgi:DNA-binding NtrC family response regulator